MEGAEQRARSVVERVKDLELQFFTLQEKH